MGVQGHTMIHTKNSLLASIETIFSAHPIIVEAGAFDGRDTIAMATRWPHAQIHAFEPVPEIFDQLQVQCKPYPQIKCHQLALSDHDGYALFYVAQKPNKPGVATQAGSLLKPLDRLKYSSIIYPHTIEVPTITLDTWAEQQQITEIDFLWLDVQGYELPILQAAQLLRHIRGILTEVHLINAYEGVAQFPQVRTWLESQGFMLHSTDFDPQQPKHFFGNVLFFQRGIRCINEKS